MSKLIVGIDPGLTGAVATNEGDVWDIPLTTKGKGQGVVKNHVDPVGLYSILWTLAERYGRDNTIVYLEAQVYRKKFKPKSAGGGEIPQGGSSIFSLGDTYGICRAFPPIMGISLVPVMPAQWKKKMQLTTDKEVCRARAIEMFPQSHDKLKRKQDHNRAEALLLALYGQKCEEGIF